MTRKPIAPMGSLAWGRDRTGTLSRFEKARLTGNLIRVQLTELADRMRPLHPAPVQIDALIPPETPLVTDARQLAEETHGKALLWHSWRTYLFGALLAQHEGIEFDRSLFFAAAILHDIALTEGHKPALCDCCFALSGGRRAEAALHAKGHDAQTCRRVGDAIAAHLNGWVSRRVHGAEAHLVSRGAVCDLFGAGQRRIAPETLRDVLNHFPRDGVIEALQFETADHHKGTRAAVMTALSGGKAPPDPFRKVSAEL